jgi:hypothetical protein
LGPHVQLLPLGTMFVGTTMGTWGVPNIWLWTGLPSSSDLSWLDSLADVTHLDHIYGWVLTWLGGTADVVHQELDLHAIGALAEANRLCLAVARIPALVIYQWKTGLLDVFALWTVSHGWTNGRTQGICCGARRRRSIVPP